MRRLEAAQLARELVENALDRDRETASRVQVEEVSYRVLASQ